ncbi:ribonucleoside-diphosphate reductase subunit alpha [Halosquirtibacter xylanolyticus]|uniref:ribonucleoside-diphosphate reductase subunit alpha n=1 Tax=Halosquirtibacter xylanolyticus TaxID=3374599 RepID=UPI0037491005|nr:ribonucleoside-diphosphate reductase subunit alpha [Prolixibacteraceae bacterium]
MMDVKIVRFSGEITDYEWCVWKDIILSNGYIDDETLYEIRSRLEQQLFNCISENQVLDILIRIIADTIDIDKPAMQYHASRLLLRIVMQEVHGGETPCTLKTLYSRNVSIGVYDNALMEMYDEASWEEINAYINHENNLSFTYAGLRQMVDKYLVQDRIHKTLYETPQEAFMLIGMFMFMKEKREIRKGLIFSFYDALSQFKVSLPTPIISGVRTPLRQFSSCCLIDVGDTTDSILASNSAVGYYTAQRAGIGLNFGRIRGKDAKIRDGSVVHTGLIPFMKIYESTTKSFTQNSIRGGGSTATVPFFHWEIEQFIRLKNNKGNEENRVRRMDFSIALHKVFRERVREDQMITLFSMEECAPLYQSMYGKDVDHFRDVYEAFEARLDIRKREVSARELYVAIIQERFETGRIYILNADHVNSHSSFSKPIYMSNLCQEITLPTSPIQSVDDTNGEIAMCILSNINLGKIDFIEELDDLTRLLVRFLDNLIDYQEYPLLSAARVTQKRRSLGIGISDLFHFLAKQGVEYDKKKARDLVHEYMERFQYGLIRSSMLLAKEKGMAEGFHETMYFSGVFPIDSYCRTVDQLHEEGLKCDWSKLREEVKRYGMRNTTLSAIPPAASSSIVSNSTAGVDPPRMHMTTKLSKHGPLVQLLPDIEKYYSSYSLAWGISNASYIKLIAVIQKFIDQSISTNMYYDLSLYENERVPIRELIEDELTAYKYGLKTLYYLNTHDGSGNEMEKVESSCSGGACEV